MRQTLSLILLFVLSSSLHAASGKFSLFIKGFKTSAVSEPRDVYVYVPAEYTRLKNKTYSVLYMHDGQNLFDPARAFLGQTWKAESALNQLISQGLMEPIIVVAIDNTKLRTFEYTHDQDASEEQHGGGADGYLNLITRELKPRIDASWRTKKDRNSTGIMGSSLGGLVSLYAGLSYNKTFGRIGALSPSIWWNEQSIMSVLYRAQVMPVKVYIDSGTAGGEKPGDVMACTEAFKQRGLVENSSLKIVIQQGALHSEKYWAQRFPLALQFLFPPN
jgi:predicted alpha/beta superfamily hydrolase